MGFVIMDHGIEGVKELWASISRGNPKIGNPPKWFFRINGVWTKHIIRAWTEEEVIEKLRHKLNQT